MVEFRRKRSRTLRYAACTCTVILLLLVVTVCIRAALVRTDQLYDDSILSEEIELQLFRMQHMVQKSVLSNRLDIYTNYSKICGEGIEWNYGFYTFYALCLEALVERAPERAEYAAKQIDRCARLMMQIPSHATESEIARLLDGPEPYAASLVSGYQCLVLGIRRKLVKDTLYDATIRGMAEALANEIRLQLQHSSGIYTSDQSTQLHALWRADQSLGTDHSETFRLWMDTMQSRFIEPETGLLYSMVSIGPDRYDSEPRSTSIAWSIIFLSDIFPDFAKQQYHALKQYRVRRFVNLAAFAEFPQLNLLEFGDMDSGPIILGISPSATGFGLCAQRLYGEEEDYIRSYRIFELFGLPRTDESGKYYHLGNGMGDAILLYSKLALPRE